MNAAQVPVVAVDIPSGIHGTSGKILGQAVRADVTVTFACAKLGHILYPGAEHAGEIRVVDIGIPAEITARAPGFEFVDQHHARGLVRPRKRDSHKGTFGHCLIIAGSTGHTGAAAMTAASAVRSGSGLVTLGIPESLNAVLEVKTTEAMTLPLLIMAGDIWGGMLQRRSLRPRRVKDVVALGRGFPGARKHPAGPSAGTIRNSPPCCRCRRIELSFSRPIGSPWHLFAAGRDYAPSGEMGTTDWCHGCRGGIGQNCHRSRMCQALSSDGGAKGARTVIAAPDGRVSINGSGNPGMASGGMGDVLTGLIASLLGQRYEPFTACQLGVFIHGHAGDLVAREKGEVGITAMDVAERIPYAFKDLQQVGSSNAT